MRYVAKAATAGPGLVLDAAEVLTGDDKLREFIGFAGGFAGGVGGAALGGLTGPAAPVAAPVLAAGGSVAGEQVAEALYDKHGKAVKRAIRQGAGTINDWMLARRDDIAREAGAQARGFLRLPPNVL